MVSAAFVVSSVVVVGFLSSRVGCWWFLLPLNVGNVCVQPIFVVGKCGESWGFLYSKNVFKNCIH